MSSITCELNIFQTFKVPWRYYSMSVSILVLKMIIRGNFFIYIFHTYTGIIIIIGILVCWYQTRKPILISLLVKLLRLLRVAFYSESVVVSFLEERFAIKKTLGQLALRTTVQVLVLPSLRRENLIIHTRI